MRIRGERRRRRTGHANSVRKEIRQIRNKNNQTTLNLREPSHIRKLQHQTRPNPHQNPNQQTPKEHTKEDADSLKQTQYTQTHSRILVFLSRLEQDDGDGVVEDGLAEDDGVKLGLDLVGVEDGEDGDGVGGGEGSADGEGFDEGDLEAVEGDAGPDEEDEAEDEGGDEGAGDGEGEDGADVAEEVALESQVSLLA